MENNTPLAVIKTRQDFISYVIQTKKLINLDLAYKLMEKREKCAHTNSKYNVN